MQEGAKRTVLARQQEAKFDVGRFLSFFLPPFSPFSPFLSFFSPFFGFLNSTAGLNSIMRSFQYGCENLHGAVAVRCKNVFKQETHDGKETKTSSPKTIIYSAAGTARFAPDDFFLVFGFLVDLHKMPQASNLVE
jgi:hypothetical protein